MTINLLEQFLVGQLTAFLLIFARTGAALMVMPMFGDVYVLPRVRLILAAGISAILTPLLMDKMPAMPASIFGLGLLLISEILIGSFIGTIARALISIVHTAGTLIAYQSSLAVSSIFDPVTGTQTAVVSNFMTITAMVLMLTLNLHHLMLASIVESYDVFDPSQLPMLEDMLKYYMRLISDCFWLGVLLATPHIVFSFIFYLIGGLMMRLMPNLQIFYVMLAPQIIIAFLLLLAILPIGMEIFTSYTEDQLRHFAGEL